SSVSCAPRPLPLPPFPTRRSSDLASTRYLVAEPCCRCGMLPPVTTIPGLRARRASRTHTHYQFCLCRIPLLLRHCLRSRLFIQRSEEHTSELQSRENLVCRLLLEK